MTIEIVGSFDRFEIRYKHLGENVTIGFILLEGENKAYINKSYLSTLGKDIMKKLHRFKDKKGINTLKIYTIEQQTII